LSTSPKSRNIDGHPGHPRNRIDAVFEWTAIMVMAIRGNGKVMGHNNFCANGGNWREDLKLWPHVNRKLSHRCFSGGRTSRWIFGRWGKIYGSLSAAWSRSSASSFALIFLPLPVG